MAFPSIVIVQNISIFIFFGIVWFLTRNRAPVINMFKGLQWVALTFGLGAITSVVFIPESYASNSLSRALAVLPNYLYWTFLVIFLVTQRRRLDFSVIFKGIFWGVLFSIVYYFFLQRIGLSSLPFFKSFSQNGFAFLLICYAPIATYFAMVRYGNKYGWIIALFLIVAGFLSGSRSSSILVLVGSFSILLIDKIKVQYLFFGATLGFLILPVVVNLALVENLILRLNPRTHNLIYNTEIVLAEDRSYLTRVAMVKKGLAIYEEFPYTGIGLNNFSNFNVVIPKDFVGAEYVVNKEDLNTKSAHNSYIALLAEGGMFLLTPFVVMLSSLILYFFGQVNFLPNYQKAIFLAICTMAIHLYFIMAIVNVFAWFLIGLGTASVYLKR